MGICLVQCIRRWEGQESGVFAKTQKKSLEIIAPGTIIIIAHIQVLFSAFYFCLIVTSLP